MHPLEQKVDRIARQARRLVFVYGFACVFALVVTLTFILGLADYLFRLEDVGVRIICTTFLAAGAALAIYFFLRPAFAMGRSLITVAQRVEQRFPQMGDRLSTTIAFLQESEEPTTGSLSLRKAVVAQTTAELEKLPLHRALDRRTSRRMTFVAIGICALAIGVCALDSRGALLATHRLALPWAAPAWPRKHVLAFEESPTRIAAGEDFTARVIDHNGELPDEVMMQYRFLDEPEENISEATMFNHRGAKEHRLNNVAKGFAYRAYGGDDDSMPWRIMEVVQPPEAINVVATITPPNYTGWPARETEGHLQGLEGSTVAIQGKATKPLQAMRMIIQLPKGETTWEATLTESGQAFELSAESDAEGLKFTESGQYRFELIDEEGVSSGASKRWNIRVIPDRPPVVNLLRPTGNLYVTNQAIIPIKTTVRDDLAIAKVDLELTPLGGNEDVPQTEDEPDLADEISIASESISIWERNNNSEESKPGEGDETVVEYRLDLKEMDLSANESLSMKVVAFDAKPQRGHSNVRRITIVSIAEFQDRLAQRQSYILNQLAEILARQREARGQTSSLEIQLDEVGAISSNELDLLQSAELNQRQLHAQLNGNPESVQSQISLLISDIRNNRLELGDSLRRMEELQTKLTEIDSGPLQRISRHLIDGLQSARDDLQAEQGTIGSAEVSDLTRESLNNAGVEQEEVIRALETLLGELSQWDSYRRIAREIDRIHRDQSALAEETEKQRLNTLTKNIADLTDQEKADLAKLARRQFELSRRFEQQLTKMTDVQKRLFEEDPVAAETVADAVDIARRKAIGGQMRESGRNLERNRVAQATENQSETDNSLREMLDVLANRREHELGRIVEGLHEASDDLAEILKQQKQLGSLRKETEARPDSPEKTRELERLTKQQHDLADQSHRLARRLQRLKAEAASESTDNAAKAMKATEEVTQSDDGQEAEKLEQQAQSELEKAQEELNQAIQQAEEELLREQMVRLEQKLTELIERQTQMITETQRLETLREKNGELDRAEKTSVQVLADGQRLLSDEVAALASGTTSEAFRFGLDGANREMLRAAALLDKRKTGSGTQTLQEAALSRLQQTANALKSEDGNDGQEPSDGAGGEGESPQGTPPEIQRLAEFRLLRSIQEQLNERTAELDKIAKNNGGLNADEEAETVEIAKEQGRLADLILKLSEPAAPNPEDDLESLPELPDL